MRVLVAGRATSVRGRYEKSVAAMGHTVVCASDIAQVVQVVRSAPPDVAILCHPDPEWIRPLRQVRTGHIYVVAAIVEMSGCRVRQAYDMGADDVMSRAASAPEIVGRVEAVRRIRRWAGRTSQGSQPAQAPFKLDDLEAIRSLDTLLGNELGEMIGTPLRAVASRQQTPVTATASVSLTLPAEQLELSLLVGVEESQKGALSKALYGERMDDAALADAVREVANTAGGALKRAALLEDHAFSVGLPKTIGMASAPSFGKSWSLRGSGVRIAVWLTSVGARPSRMPIADLREGMVLTQPLLNKMGRTLVAAGAVLTERTVSRLIQLVGGDTLVEVASA